MQGWVQIAEVSRRPLMPNRSSILTSLSSAAFTGQHQIIWWVYLGEAEDNQDGVTNQSHFNHNPQIVPCERIKRHFISCMSLLLTSTTANVKSSNTAAFHKWKALLPCLWTNNLIYMFYIQIMYLKVTLVGKVKRRCCYSTLGVFSVLVSILVNISVKLIFCIYCINLACSPGYYLLIQIHTFYICCTEDRHV